MVFSPQLRFLILILIVSGSTSAYSATVARFLSGTKSQSYSTSSQEQIGSSPLGLLALIDVEMIPNIYFSFGTSFELSTDSFSTSGFTLYGGLNYYLIGNPKAMIVTDSVETSMELYQKYSVYATFGIFQKEIKLRNPNSEVVEDESLGGIMLGGGVNYNLNSKVFVNGQLQYLSSGLGTNEEYSSFELYVGLGLRI
jgi:hypothetical protein